MRLFRFLLALLFLIPLSACVQTASEENPLQSPTPQTSTIVQEGIITPKEITIFENGTHFLTTDEETEFLLKSSIIDLSRFEDERVVVTGETETKQENEMPVITVFAVDLVGPPAESRQSQFNEPEFGFSMELPGNWQRNVAEPEGVPVLQYFPEDQAPVITVDKLDTQSPAGLAAQQEMTSGISITVSGRQGWRLLVPGGGIDVFVRLREEGLIIVFHFIPGQNPEAQQATFYEMLGDLEWIDLKSASGSPSPSPTSGKTIYCGGIAKKLCPSGYRCEFSNLEDDATGICVDSSLPPSDISAALATSPSPTTTTNTEESSPSPLPTSSTSEDVLPGWKEYTNERLSYSFSVPVSWWWRHVTPSTGSALSRLEIAPTEVTAENRIATIEVFPGSRSKTTETAALGIITISQPRDLETYFEISGDAQYAAQIRNIAASISSF